ncbi:hypothetical protein [Marinomonas spartinae]|uniref:hypothetical protein n=1 Tax=Marinomonas spartinae TaxID=1792290 RepID=UPI0018F12C0E|nr:hypothetical protein [Marinomonas spartinae]MBJ7555426.1 hypothetical protein [Marinomonas spartinae]
MKERPILFNTDMVKAILDGRKTQTRRPVKSQPSNGWAFEGAESGGAFGRITSSHPKKGKFGAFVRRRVGTDFPEADIEVSPYGMPGDHLWVRETFCPVDDTEFGGGKWVDYRATPSDSESHPAGWHNAPDDSEAMKWKPSIHMPRWACRLVLEITNVRLERIQDITEKDAKAEGFKTKEAFIETWEKLYPNPDQNNQWAWVVEFKIIELNGKKMEQAA